MCYKKEMSSKVGCFAAFCHHRLVVISACIHVYRFLSLKTAQVQICEQWLQVEKI